MIGGYPRTPITAATVKVLVHANSLGAGVGASSAATYWPAVMAGLAPMAGKGVTVVNASVGGIRIGDASIVGSMAQVAPSTVDVNFETGKLNILVVHEFINELKDNGNNPTNAYNFFKNYCNARRAAATAAGKKLTIIVLTTTPCTRATGQVDTDARMVSVVACNNLMRKEFRKYADVLCDVAAMPPFAAMFAAGIWTPTAFQAAGVYARSDGVTDDYTHLGDAGYAIMGAAVARAIARVRKIP